MEAEKIFKKLIAENAKDTYRRQIFDDNVSRYDSSVHQALMHYSNVELARKRAGSIRAKGINGLEKYLIEFEANMVSNGGKVLWAQDAEEATTLIINVLKSKRISKVTRSFSLLADEIGLSDAFNEEGIACSDVNIGEYILTHFNEDPRHPSSVLISKRLSDIKEALKNEDHISSKHTAIDVIEYLRKKFKFEFKSSVASVTGANYLIADTGSVCISENSGDAVLNSVIPDIHIVLAGIDKIIPSIVNLDTLLPLYATYSTGERMNAYNSLINGPSRDSEVDGPGELYVILIDNGRSGVLEKKLQRRALSCIDCGACHNACPVFRIIDGQGYGTTYTGPIGSVITPWMNEPEEFIHLSYSSPASAGYNDVCPVSINLSQQLLYNRNDYMSLGNQSILQRFTMEGWHRFLKSRKWMDAKPNWKNYLIRRLNGGRLLGSQITLSDFNFKQLWEERREGKSI